MTDIYLAALIVFLSQLTLHYAPWPMLFQGKPLHPLVNYSTGVLAMVVPLTVLYWYWQRTWYWVLNAHLIALWAVVLASGLAVGGAYLLDAILVRTARARELAEQLKLREEA